MSTDQRILPQFRLGARVGGALELASQTMRYISIPNQLMIAALAYYNTPVQQFLPVWLWFTAIPLGYGLAMVAHHVLLHKAWVEYNSTQNADPTVNPHYKDMLDGFERLEGRLDELEAKVDE